MFVIFILSVYTIKASGFTEERQLSVSLIYTVNRFAVEFVGQIYCRDVVGGFWLLAGSNEVVWYRDAKLLVAGLKER